MNDVTLTDEEQAEWDNSDSGYYEALRAAEQRELELDAAWTWLDDDGVPF